MIKIGDRLPEGSLGMRDNNGMHTLDVPAFFAGKKVVLFAVPGAFTPTCSAKHLPGFVDAANDFKARGVDHIVCLSVNDAFVMEAWGQSQNADQVMMVADGDGAFTRALGLDMDSGSFGGLRSRRYAMVVEDGRITALNVEAPKAFEVSDAQTLLTLV